MRRQEFLVKVSLLLALVCAAVFTCQNSTYRLYETNAAMPVILAQPKSANYNWNDHALPLFAEVKAPEFGVLSYKWFERTESGDVPVGFEAAYTPETNIRKMRYYYVIITNTNSAAAGRRTASVTSDIANILVRASDVLDAGYPIITADPEDGEYQLYEPAVPLSVEAHLPQEEENEGLLTYEWFCGNAADGTDALVQPETDKYFTPRTNTQSGDFYYFAEVSNNNSAKNGLNRATTRSAIAHIKVTPLEAASPPIIRVQPESADYYIRETAAAPLKVDAISIDSGALSYRWYRKETTGWQLLSSTPTYTPLPGQNGAQETYKVEITSTVSGALTTKTAMTVSTEAVIRWLDTEQRRPSEVKIESQPEDVRTPRLLPSELFATFSYLPHAGYISDKVAGQWYKVDRESNSVLAIEGAVNTSSFYPPVTDVGVNLYYVVVSNIVEAGEEKKITNTASRLIKFAVTKTPPTPSEQATVDLMYALGGEEAASIDLNTLTVTLKAFAAPEDPLTVGAGLTLVVPEGLSLVSNSLTVNGTLKLSGSLSLPIIDVDTGEISGLVTGEESKIRVQGTEARIGFSFGGVEQFIGENGLITLSGDEPIVELSGASSGTSLSTYKTTFVNGSAAINSNFVIRPYDELVLKAGTEVTVGSGVTLLLDESSKLTVEETAVLKGTDASSKLTMNSGAYAIGMTVTSPDTYIWDVESEAWVKPAP